MAKQRILILDSERIEHKLQRMAYQIWEHNSKEKEITLIGVQGSGLAVAENLAARVRKISQLKVQVLSLKLNKKQPLKEEISLPEGCNSKSVVLVDDVANSGKTLLYALKPLLAFELQKILIAVLVDRRHKSFPISPDIIGHSISTTLQEHIEVETEGKKITAAYLQ
jgi:pyrimidine operon attenuation protein/uracil phosphoribosyltransferase